MIKYISRKNLQLKEELFQFQFQLFSVTKINIHVESDIPENNFKTLYTIKHLDNFKNPEDFIRQPDRFEPDRNPIEFYVPESMFPGSSIPMHFP